MWQEKELGVAYAEKFLIIRKRFKMCSTDERACVLNAGREATANVCFTVGSEQEQKYQNKTK